MEVSAIDFNLSGLAQSIPGNTSSKTFGPTSVLTLIANLMIISSTVKMNGISTKHNATG